ncbi:ester cyclase [Nonomuraea insulae]|uniref:Ester cyclase n=2 Tax=Nonomuraea insulae TaxID=1616787 RepID=A0ABW1CQ53_9ACTN
MTLAKMKATTLRCFEELWGECRYDVVDQLVGDGFACHAPGARDIRGRAAFEALVRSYHTGFPGLKISVRGQLGEGELVVTEFTMSGQHTGSWGGVRPTGRPMSLECVAFSRFSYGLIAEQWYEWDRRKLLEQLALVPVLAG